MEFSRKAGPQLLLLHRPGKSTAKGSKTKARRPPCLLFFFSSRRRHTRFDCDWSSDVCSSDLPTGRRALVPVEARGAGATPPAPAPPLTGALRRFGRALAPLPWIGPAVILI